jgi:hypothetical protein
VGVGGVCPEGFQKAYPLTSFLVSIKILPIESDVTQGVAVGKFKIKLEVPACPKVVATATSISGFATGSIRAGEPGEDSYQMSEF